MRARRRRSPEPAATPIRPDPDQAWKALSLVNDWVKHAETKLGVVLAATGVSAGVLFNLIRSATDPNGQTVPCLAFVVAASLCATSLLVTAVLAMTGLFPRLTIGRKKEADSVNPLFFHDIARAYRGDGPTYGEVLHTLTTNPNDLVRHVAQQVHANATVAYRKYRWANGAVRCLILGLVSLGAAALIDSLSI